MKTTETDMLIVEDDEATRLMMEGALEHEGHTVKSCETAEEAWDYLQENTPNMVFLDINLPGMTGLELCEKIRTELKNHELYIVAATAKDQPEDLAKILQSGANDYMAKPLHPKVLNIRARVAKFTIQKISESREFQKKLGESEARYRLISENGRDSIITIKTDGTMTYISPGTENLLGFRIQGLLNRKIQEFIHPEDLDVALPKGQDEILNGNLDAITEFRLKNFDGAYIWVEALHRPLQNPKGTGILEWISYIREAQSVKNTEHKIQALEDILEGHALNTEKILERIAHTFGGKALLLAEEKSQESSYCVILETGEKSENTEKLLKLLWHGAREEEKITANGQTLLHPYIVPKDIQMLVGQTVASQEPPSQNTHWESGMIQPIPNREDSPEETIKLVILSKDIIQERDLRTTRAILKLAGGILGLKTHKHLR